MGPFETETIVQHAVTCATREVAGVFRPLLENLLHERCTQLSSGSGASANTAEASGQNELVVKKHDLHDLVKDLEKLRVIAEAGMVDVNAQATYNEADARLSRLETESLLRKALDARLAGALLELESVCRHVVDESSGLEPRLRAHVTESCRGITDYVQANFVTTASLTNMDTQDSVLRSAKIGLKVRRGPDWTYNDQDGGFGQTGIVIGAREAEQVAQVRWPNGAEHWYCTGQGGRYELYKDEVEATKLVEDLQDYCERVFSHRSEVAELKANLAEFEEHCRLVFLTKAELTERDQRLASMPSTSLATADLLSHRLLKMPTDSADGMLKNEPQLDLSLDTVFPETQKTEVDSVTGTNRKELRLNLPLEKHAKNDFLSGKQSLQPLNTSINSLDEDLSNKMAQMLEQQLPAKLEDMHDKLQLDFLEKQLEDMRIFSSELHKHFAVKRDLLDLEEQFRSSLEIAGGKVDVSYLEKQMSDFQKFSMQEFARRADVSDLEQRLVAKFLVTRSASPHEFVDEFVDLETRLSSKFGAATPPGGLTPSGRESPAPDKDPMKANTKVRAASHAAFEADGRAESPQNGTNHATKQKTDRNARAPPTRRESSHRVPGNLDPRICGFNLPGVPIGAPPAQRLRRPHTAVPRNRRTSAQVIRGRYRTEDSPSAERREQQ